MATKADIQVAIAETIRFWYFHWSNIAANHETMEADLVAALVNVNNYSRGREVLDVVQKRMRGSLSASLAAADLRAALRPLHLEYAELLGITTTDEQEIITAMIEDMVTQDYDVQSRDMTLDTSATAGGSNIGTGSVVRLTKDALGQTIESLTAAEDIDIKCVEDQASGNGAERNKEIFEIEGEQGKIDNLGVWGFTQSGLKSRLAVIHEGNEGLIQNGSFSSFKEVSGTLQGDNADGTPYGLAYWNMQSGTATGLAIQDSQVSTSNDHFYCNIDTIQTPASLKVSATKYIEQKLNIQAIDFDRPYLPFMTYRGDLGLAPNGSKVKMWWGSKSQEFTYNGVAASWQVTMADRDEDLWPKNWANTDQPKLKVEATTLASGYFLWDSVFLIPGTKFGNTWWWIYPGNNTPFQKGDSFAFSDSETGAIIQQAYAIAYGRHLRHIASTPSWAEPTAP